MSTLNLWLLSEEEDSTKESVVTSELEGLAELWLGGEDSAVELEWPEELTASEGIPSVWIISDEM